VKKILKNSLSKINFSCGIRTTPGIPFGLADLSFFIGSLQDAKKRAENINER
jgi:hypothetical protein